MILFYKMSTLSFNYTTNASIYIKEVNQLKVGSHIIIILSYFMSVILHGDFVSNKNYNKYYNVSASRKFFYY